MKSSGRVMGPAVIGFLGLSAIAVIAAMANRAGALDASVARRTIGMVVGLMAIVTGNFLPKLRPLGANEMNVGAVVAAERTAGWILVLLGIAFVVMFALVPLRIAVSLSPIAALGAVVLIAVDWIWVGRRRSIAGEPTRRLTETRTVAAWLLFALGYVLVSASLKFLTDDSRSVRELGAWIVVGFIGAYSIFYAVMDFRRRAARRGPRP